MGVEMIKEGKLLEALECFDRVGTLYPNYFRVYLWKAKTLFRLNRNKESIDNYNKSLELNPRSFEVYLWKSMELYNLQYFEQAALWLKKVIEQRQDFDAAHQMLAMCYYKIDKIDESIEWYCIFDFFLIIKISKNLKLDFMNKVLTKRSLLIQIRQMHGSTKETA